MHCIIWKGTFNRTSFCHTRFKGKCYPKERNGQGYDNGILFYIIWTNFDNGQRLHLRVLLKLCWDLENGELTMFCSNSTNYLSSVQFAKPLFFSIYCWMSVYNFFHNLFLKHKKYSIPWLRLCFLKTLLKFKEDQFQELIWNDFYTIRWKNNY